MGRYYPLFLSVEGRPCTVVGGGEVAERKVLALVEAGARVKVIAPTLTPRLQELAGEGGVEARLRPYAPGDLAGSLLVFAATADPEVNQAVVREAEERAILVNVVDSPEQCDFILPSMVRRGALVIAISTGGLSPALARHLREELERSWGEEYAVLLSLISRVRQELHRQGEYPSAQRWQQALDDGLLDLVRQGEVAQAEARLKAALTRPSGALSGKGVKGGVRR